MATSDHPLVLDLGKVTDVQTSYDLGLVSGNETVITSKWTGYKSLRVFGHSAGLFLTSHSAGDLGNGWTFNWTGADDQIFVHFPDGFSIPNHIVPWRGRRKVGVSGAWVYHTLEGLALVASAGVVLRSAIDLELDEPLAPTSQNFLTLDNVSIGVALYANIGS